MQVDAKSPPLQNLVLALFRSFNPAHWVFKGYWFIFSPSPETLTSPGVETYDGRSHKVSNFQKLEVSFSNISDRYWHKKALQMFNYVPCTVSRTVICCFLSNGNFAQFKTLLAAALRNANCSCLYRESTSIQFTWRYHQYPLTCMHRVTFHILLIDIYYK